MALHGHQVSVSGRSSDPESAGGGDDVDAVGDRQQASFTGMRTGSTDADCSLWASKSIIASFQISHYAIVIS
jgi:hypothetical protein